MAGWWRSLLTLGPQKFVVKSRRPEPRTINRAQNGEKFRTTINGTHSVHTYIRIIIINVLSLCRSRNHSGDNKRSRVANHVPGLVAAVPWPGNERRLAEWGRGQTSVQWPWQYAARFIVSRVPASTAAALLPGQHAGVQTQVGFLTTYNRPPMDRSGLINCHDDKQKRDTFRSNFALFPPSSPDYSCWTATDRMR